DVFEEAHRGVTLESDREFSRGSTNTEPGAVATGSWTQRKDSQRRNNYTRPSPAECSTRSLPLPVLYLLTHRKTSPASGYEGLRAMLYILLVENPPLTGLL